MTTGIVTTIGQKCKRCYSCIRECPARAIRVINGQAVVIEERCISCGHCVKVCSQNAKKIMSDYERVLFELLPTRNCAVIIAPSFPASFSDNYKSVPAALKSAGFKYAAETAFGADMISRRYEELISKSNGGTVISSPCPAVNNFIEKYFPEIVPQLAQVVSPMIAMGRYIKKNYGPETKVVFIGPCIAKKSEYMDDEVSDAIDAVLTFKELKDLFGHFGIDPAELPESEFDPPHSFMGKVFPLTGGLLKTANARNDILEKEIIVVEGKKKVEEVINEIKDRKIKSKFVDILFCEGCINGPAIDSGLDYYSRREKVINFVNDKISSVDKNIWKSELYNNRYINITRKFHNRTQRRPMPSEEEIQVILGKTNKFAKNDELNCGACGYPSCREYAVAVAKGLAEDDMCLPFLIEKLEAAYTEIKETQEQLHNAEKLASIGQLAAGVAHEINNPLGSILIYASMLRKKIGKVSDIPQSAEDLQLIIDEADRCRNIVSNLLNFARQGRLMLSDVNIKEMISVIIRTIEINPDFSGIDFEVTADADEIIIPGDLDQLKQVFLNIIQNGCEALSDRESKKISVSIGNDSERIRIIISDNGCGIPQENLNKLFTPFFTTKKMGKGTGLGLAIAYGIIKMHGGDISVKSVINSGTDFMISLPINSNSRFN